MTPMRPTGVSASRMGRLPRRPGCGTVGVMADTKASYRLETEP
jgi:hypothetical protein